MLGCASGLQIRCEQCEDLQCVGEYIVLCRVENCSEFGQTVVDGNRESIPGLLGSSVLMESSLVLIDKNTN